jgi:tRNA dimethylallyltransferase
VVGGPTAAGKTALALAIAETLDAVIVSADAMQVYRGMDIGTAKATPEEQARVPHFAIDVVEPDGPFHAADFLAICDAVFARHPRVVVCGGTAMYLQALQRGLVETPPPDADLRAELAALPDLHAALHDVDPVLAARLHPNDHVRILRGLEVHRLAGVRLSDLHAEHAARPARVHVEGLWLDRPDLDARIDARVHTMMGAGYLEEVRGLLERVDRGVKPMRSLGYRHLADHLLDGLDLDEAVRRTQRDSRRFARKQRTWRKHLPLVDAPSDVESARADGLALARALWDEV